MTVTGFLAAVACLHSAPKFPLKVSESRRHLVDSRSANDGSFALSHLPSKRALTIDLSELSGEQGNAAWFNPRTGGITRLGQVTSKRRQPFELPSDGDWVLVLDDSGRYFSAQDLKP